MGCEPTKSELDEKIGPSKSDFILKKTSLFEQDYKLDIKLGSGSHAEVWRVTKKLSGKSYAAKIIKKSLLKRSDITLERIESEFSSLRTLDSPYIIKIFGLYEDKRKFYIIMELIHGPNLLEHVLKNSVALKEAVIAIYAKQILLGINHCHKNGIIHRDMKLDNIMFSDAECKTIKIVDFGCAKLFGKGSSDANTILGTPLYMAPEVLIKQSYTPKCDIWSIGIILFILMSREIPFSIGENCDKDSLFKQITTIEFSISRHMSSGCWKYISDGAKLFLLRMLDSVPSERASAEDLLKDPWLISHKSIEPNQSEVDSVIKNLRSTITMNKFQHVILTYISYHSDVAAETQKIRETFEKFDTDHDQLISKDEFRRGLAGNGVIISEKEINDLYSKLDKDGMGTINYSEFVEAAMDMDVLLDDNSLEAAFTFIDSDNSGSIELKEIKKAMKSGWISEKQIEEIFKEIDLNNDNTISLPEFKAMMKQIVSNKKSA